MPSSPRRSPDAGAAATGAGTPRPAADDAWAEEPWPTDDPWVTATVTTREADVGGPSAPARAAPAASAGSEPRGLDLLRSVFPGRVLQVVGNASEAAVERGTDTASSAPLDPDEAALDPDPDPDPGGLP